MASSLAADGHQAFSWRNYLAHAVEGGLYMGGIAFLANETVVPTMIDTLGGPTWLVGLAPLLMPIGFFLPSFFFAHRVERLERTLPLLLVAGVIQRLPYLLAAAALWFLAADYPAVALMAVLAAPLCSGLVGGVTASAWLELTSKILPPNRRASAFALRLFVATTIGLVAGAVVERVLKADSGPGGFATLHLCTFAFLVASYLVFSCQREERDARRSHAPPRSLAANLAAVPGLLRDFPALRLAMVVRVLALGVHLTVPYLVLHARSVTGADESLAGRLVMAQMLGTFAGNLFAGWVGDRHGAGRLVALALGLEAAFLLAVPLAASEAGFLLLFALWGAAFACDHAGHWSLAMAVSPVARRPTSLALLQLSWATALVVVGVVGGQVAVHIGDIRAHVAVSLGCVAAAAVVLGQGVAGRR